MAIRVYIVEDHVLFRETLVDYLELNTEIEICGMAQSAEQATDELPEIDPAVVLLDLSLPGRSGLALLEQIRTEWQIPCVVLSGHGERSHVERAFASGAGGYVLKGRPHEVPTAIERVLKGERYVSEALDQTLKYDRGASNGTGATEAV